jgi:hypothetical protein
MFINTQWDVPIDLYDFNFGSSFLRDDAGKGGGRVGISTSIEIPKDSRIKDKHLMSLDNSFMVSWRFALFHIQCVRKVAVHLYRVLEVMSTNVHYRPHVGFNSCTAVAMYRNRFSLSRTALCAVASPISISWANLRNDFEGLRSMESEMSTNLLSLSSNGLPLRSASSTEPVSRNSSVSLRTALR